MNDVTLGYGVRMRVDRQGLDDAVVRCTSERQAHLVRQAIEDRWGTTPRC
ncbi:hypothetical protein O7632_17570 [Solwaraspora sp. WMMD406]|nr:hypothetical protein [Solwaraspora sp. WMMD406]MDG4765895.1 hypothetical protein [Solwaraspora sp. WMMD406]